MKRALVLAAVGEAATGVALQIVPSLVGRLLFGEELTGVAIPVARVTGIALIGLSPDFRFQVDYQFGKILQSP